jgi:hypothetical protein
MDGSKIIDNNSKVVTKSNLDKNLRNRRGQVVIEYVLLMVMMAGIGAFLVRNLVSRNIDEPGILVTKWNQILNFIAQDNPED